MAARRVPPEKPIPPSKAERMQKHLRETVANNIQRFRTDAGLTQRQLSERANVSQTYISQTEQGKRNLSLDLIALLALALEKTPAELVSD
jgi:transcriptional regulator with XRE-family HTH domain